MGRGEPRVDYSRLYILLPPPCGVEWAYAVIDALWDSQRPTIGGSADDAGIGNLTDRRVLAVNPDLWNGDLAAFFAEHYPDVIVQEVYADTPNHLHDILTGSEVTSVSVKPGSGEEK